MSEKIINVDNIDLVSLFGENNIKFNKLKSYFPKLQLISRGNKIKILGNNQEIDKFLEKIPEDMNLELNISCPNINKKLICNNLQDFLNEKRKWCIIKLSPITEMELIDKYYESGFRQFHCSNTLPVKNGGLSGESLIPYTSELIKKIKEKYPDTELIAGGGIRSIDTLLYYKECGANHFSISTVILNPILFGILYSDYINLF